MKEKKKLFKHLQNYQRYMLKAVEELAQIYMEDGNAYKEADDFVKATTSSLTLAILDLGKLAAMQDHTHIVFVSKKINEYLAEVPEGEKTLAEFAKEIADLGSDKVLNLTGGNC